MTGSDIARVQVGDIEIACETFGDAGNPPVLLVMGLATQMIGWPDDFCRGLAERGLFVVRFDNRDIGLSTHLHDAGAPDIMAVFGGDASSVPYALTDLAEDTVGLLDALGLDSAHLVGASMGGMIAQLVAIRHPKRVRSLTSIMSTTGDPSVGTPAEAAMTVLMAPPASSSTRPASGSVRPSPSTGRTTPQASLGSSRRSSPRPTAPSTSPRSRCPRWSSTGRTTH